MVQQVSSWFWSNQNSGAALLQWDEHYLGYPIFYFSKKFMKRQLHYSTTEKEALALLLALQHFRVYLGSSPIPSIVFSDYYPLVFFCLLCRCLMCWSLLLQHFNTETCFKKGPENTVADALSGCKINISYRREMFGGFLLWDEMIWPKIVWVVGVYVCAPLEDMVVGFSLSSPSGVRMGVLDGDVPAEWFR